MKGCELERAGSTITGSGARSAGPRRTKSLGTFTSTCKTPYPSTQVSALALFPDAIYLNGKYCCSFTVHDSGDDKFHDCLMYVPLVPSGAGAADLQSTHFEEQHVYRLEWQPGPSGYLEW